jgi:quinol monooxygenase YgiN
MIVITAKFRVKPEHVETWPEIVAGFTTSTRAEAGCLWFDWSRSLDRTDEYVLVEAFRDDEAGAAHVHSDHFKATQRDLPPYLLSTPLIVHANTPGETWSELGELEVSE